MIRDFFRSILWHRWVLLVLLLLPLSFLPHYVRQHCGDTIESYFGKNDPTLLAFKEYQKLFGDFTNIAIVFKDSDIFTAQNIELIRKISKKFESIDGVRTVLSITSVTLPYAESDRVDFRNAIPEEEVSGEKLEQVKKDFMAHPALINTLISKDATTTAIVGEIKPAMSSQEKAALLKTIEREIGSINQGSRELHFVGSPYIEAETRRILNRDNWLLSLIIVVVGSVFIFWVLRDVVLTSIIVVQAIAVMVCAVGIFVWLGNDIGIVTILLSPLLLATALAAGLSTTWQMGVGADEKLSTAVPGQGWRYGMFGLLAVMIGFFSLTASPVTPLQKLGFHSIVGIVLIGLFAVIGLPSILQLFSARIQKSAKRKMKTPGTVEPESGLTVRIALAAGKCRSVVVVLCIAIGGFGIYGMVKVPVDSSPSHFISTTNPIVGDVKFIERHLTGTLPVEFVLATADGTPNFSDIASLQKVDEVRRLVMEHMKDDFTSSVSILDYLKEMNQAFNPNAAGAIGLPQTSAELSDNLELMGLTDETALARMISVDRNRLRMAFSSNFDNTSASSRVSAFFAERITPLLGPGIGWKKVGLTTLLDGLNDMIARTRYVSLGLVVLGIFILLVIALRGIKLALIGLFLSLLPVCFVIGVMALGGMAFDAVTVITLSLSLCYGAANLIPLLLCYRRHAANNLDPMTAFTTTLEERGTLYIVVTCLLALAFFVLCLSSLRPIVSLGALMGFALLASIPCQLVGLTATLSQFLPLSTH